MDHDQLKGLLNRSCEVLKRQLKELNSIWTDCGYNNDQVVEKGETVYRNVSELLKEMLEEENFYKQEFIIGVENLFQEAATLSEELHVHIDTDCGLNVPLCKLEENLSCKLEEYRKIKSDRLSQYKALMEREEKLCSMLGVDKSVPFRKLATEQQLSELEQHVISLSQKEASLRKRFVNTKTNIISMLRELEELPKTEFENEVVVGKDSHFKVTSSNMAKLQRLHEDLEKRLDQKRKYINQLREKLSLSWFRLRENTLHQEEFLSAHPGFSNATIIALKKEMARCDNRKRQNKALFISNIRKELEELWEQCFYSKEDRLKFFPFYSETFNEDLLEAHENEVQKLRDELEHNRDLYYHVRDWKNLNDSLKVLNERSSDKTRLFKNRGGQLLKEEKERNFTEKKLRKIEEEIINLLIRYEAVHGTPFLYFGNELRKMLQKKRIALHESKVKETSKKPENLATGCKRKIPLQTTNGTKRTRHLPETCDSKVSHELKLPRPAETVGVNDLLENAIGGDLYDFEKPENLATGCKRKIPLQTTNGTKRTRHLPETCDSKSGIERMNERAPCRCTLISSVLKPRNAGRGIRSPTKATSVVKSPLSNFRTPIKPPRKLVGTPLTSQRTPQKRDRAVKRRSSSAPRPLRLF